MSALDRVFGWFESRGWTPFPFQREAWRAYLAGESGLIHAATGTGKSYAALLGPLLEALADTPAKSSRAKEPLRVLWITPLRALANDLANAFRDAVDALGLDWDVETRTGDTKASVRARQRNRLPAILITTPESLSLLLSFPDAKERLSTVRCVVADEWHELIGGKRGVQVELALARLRSWNPALRTWGLSATLGNLAEARDVLLGPGRSGRLISGTVPKTYEVRTIVPASIERFPWAGHLGLRLLPEVLDAIAQAGSTLLFCNVRSQAEAWFQAILTMRPEWLETIALHHGSIDRRIREKVEQRLRAGELRCVVCTSSLDLGVDFTPVDQVLQVGSPKGVARLMQRAGRSGHQPGSTSNVLGVPTHAFELVEFAAARDALHEGAVEAREPLDRPLDVLVQHIVTVALGGGFVEEELLAEVRGTCAFNRLTDDEWRWTMQFVAQGGPALHAYPQFNRIVQDENGRWHVASATIARMHRVSIGTITGDPVLELRYLRGRRLGTIEESFISRLRPGERFVFAGKVLQLSRVKDMIAYVKTASGGKAQYPRWYGGKLSFSTQLGRAVRGKLDEARTHSYDGAEMDAVRPLLELQQHWSRIPAPSELLIEMLHSREGDHLYVFPFHGRIVHEGVAALLAYRLTRRTSTTVTATQNDYGFELLSRAPLHIDEAVWREVISTDNLLEDLLSSVNAAELARRHFREIARIAGLVFPGYPGVPKKMRQLQASSGLFFDVFSKYDPANLLLDQARREVLERQLEFVRVRRALEDMASLAALIVRPARLTPLAFPLWADRMQASHVSSETWSDRVKRMAAQLERAAQKKQTRPKRARGRTESPS